MKLKTSQILRDLDGSTLPYQMNSKEELVTVGLAIAVSLSKEQQEDPMRAMLVAKKIYEAKETIELDEVELEYIKSSMKASKLWAPVVRGQVLLALTKVEEDKPKK